MRITTPRKDGEYKEAKYLYHGDEFTLENKHYPGQSMYAYYDNGFGCKRYGIKDKYRICKKDLLENGDC